MTKDKLLELIAGLELAIYRESKADAQSYQYMKALEDKLQQTKDQLKEELYGIQAESRDAPATGEH